MLKEREVVQAERKRNKHININLIVEEHYESYFEQEEEYIREIANRF